MAHDTIEGPAYVVSSNGFWETVEYVDGWCYGKSDILGTFVEPTDVTRAIHANIRQHPERNGLPRYWVSDHGNVSKMRAVRLRRLG